ncbi:MAG: PHA/PHB synthase family protein [Sphingomonadaceae bacterium]
MEQDSKLAATVDAPDLKGSINALLDLWGAVLAPVAAANRDHLDPKDKRFAAPEWNHPVFAVMRQGYAMMTEAMMRSVEMVPAIDEAQRENIRFTMRTVLEAMSPANSPFTNPVALRRALDTNGESLTQGFQKMMDDLERGQLTHTDAEAFELGRNLATAPGKVVHETRLYQLIQYAPTTPTVLKTPLVIFPPWINRFYILDLTPEKSFVRWAVAQGLTVFVVSWKSADDSLADIIWDDYVAAQIEVIDTVRGALDVKSVHTIGYCVAGTTLAGTLAVLAATGRARAVKSATFFTAQVDFSEAGELLNFVDDAHLALIDTLSQRGWLDGRFLALTFNLLRGNDLIWVPAVNNYLLGEARPAFDLLHWNGDVTNLAAKWHRHYLTEFYRENRMVQPGALSVLGVPVDLGRVETPAYIQAGRDDHISPAVSVWKMTQHLKGPMRFVLAGSGHIAGVVNPPAAMKYQHWINDAPLTTLADFIAGATEIRGSWWPDWIGWIREHGKAEVAAAGARIPGAGALQAIEDAPGRYVRMR